MNFSAPGSNFAAPAPGGYVPGNGEYSYPPWPGYGGYQQGYGGYQPPPMQPQKKTSMFKKFFKKLGQCFCGLVRAAATDAATDALLDNIDI